MPDLVELFAEHIRQLDNQRREMDNLIDRFVILEARLATIPSLDEGESGTRPTLTEPPASPVVLKAPAAPQSPTTTTIRTSPVEPTHRHAAASAKVPERADRSGPSWLRDPISIGGPTLGISRRIQTLLDGDEARLFELRSSLTVVLLRAHLIQGLCIQPNIGGANENVVLVYKDSSRTSQERAVQTACLIVDLIASLDPDHRLAAHTHERLPGLVPVNGLPPGTRNHVEARARWRRSIPVDVHSLRDTLPIPGSGGRTWLEEHLPGVTQGLSFGSLSVEGVLQRAAQLGFFYSPANRPSPQAFADLMAAPPAAGPPTSAQVPPQLPPRPRPLDDDLIAARREATSLALQELQELDEEDLDDETDESPPEEELTRLSGPLHALAMILGREESYPLAAFRELAGDRGLIPLDAVRAINDWADHITHGQYGSPIEVDEGEGMVWIDPNLGELLS